MISQKDARFFVKWIQEPVEFRSEVLSKDKNERIGEYQKQAKSFFNDLKSDDIITYQNVFLDKHSIVQRSDLRRIKLLELSANMTNKLWNSKEFTGDEQFFILCMIHNYFTESIKSLFLPYVKEIFNALDEKVQKRLFKKGKLPSTLTLGPVMKVLREYKKGKYKDLFSDINVNLRNSIAHFTISFGEKNISYNGGHISGSEFLLLVIKLELLDAILSHSIMKEFPIEVKQYLSKKAAE
jgi:hypothetical protein